MIEQLEQSIIQGLKESRDSPAESVALLDKKKYKLNPIRKEGWISPIEEQEAAIAFVDGGECAIIETPAAALHRIRTAIVFVKGQKIAKAMRKEGYALARAVVTDNGAVNYEVEFFESNLDRAHDAAALKFESHELTHETISGQATAPGKAAEMARRLAEIAAARHAAEELGSLGDSLPKFVVLDGTLEASSDLEAKGIKDLFAAAAGNKVTVGAIAKTCSLLASNGQALVETAEKTGNGGEGFVIVGEGLIEKHHALIAIAKLNRSARHLFRIEAASAGELAKLASVLKRQANDLAFPGYPYGMVMADRLARIGNAESEMTKAKVMATAKGETRKLLHNEIALDAHRILDSL